VKGSSLASRRYSLVCPLCAAGELDTSGRNSARCGSCGGSLSGEMLETLCEITALPDALGSHACECGHPQMRRLPDGVFHCPACGSEVLPLGDFLLSELGMTVRSRTLKPSQLEERVGRIGGFSA
jgi:ribosomal protein L37AE/L43A